jgi:N-acetylmuramoyl-L-alanine amidase
MPGVLVEIGYLNNMEEENYLNSEEGQNEVAMAIFKAIKYYKKESEKTPVQIVTD